MRALFLFLLALPLIILLTCCKDESPTGYKGKIEDPHDSYIVKTCNEEEFLQKWWKIETDNVVLNTLVPSYKDYCTYIEEYYIFFWNVEDLYGYYNYDFHWECVNDNTLHVTNEPTGDKVEIKIYGKVSPDCYDVKITYGLNIANADICSCEYNGP